MSSPSQTASPKVSATRPLALLLLIAGCIFFTALGRLPLLEPDEGRNAEVAREMIVTRDYVTPHYDSLAYLDKPAFQFWLIAGSFRCFGVSEWAARFPSALLALACVLLAWLLSQAMRGPDHPAAFLAGIILAVSPLFFVFARTVIFDMTLTFFVSLALLCFWLNDRRETRSASLDLAAFAAMGVAAITKGPVGFLLPLITLAVYYALSRRFRDLRKVHWAAGWAVFLAVVLPWFVAVSLRNPGFPKYALWEESLLRFSTGAHLHRSQSIFYYIPVYLGGFFPWSLFLILVAWARRKSWRALAQPRCSGQLFLLSWAGVVFVFFTISHSKLPGYFLPATVPLSILTGWGWREAQRDGGHAPPWMNAGFAAMMIAGLLLAGAALLLRAHGFEVHLEKKMSPQAAAMLYSALLRGGIIIAALAFLARNLALRSRRPALGALSFAVVAVTLPLLVIRWFPALHRYSADNSSRQLARLILTSPDRGLSVYGFYYFRTSLPFYLRRPVGLVSTDGGQLTSNYAASRYKQLLEKNPAVEIAAAPGKDRGGRPEGSNFPLLMTGQDLFSLSRSPGPPFLLMLRNDEINLALENAGSMQPLWQTWEYSVWKKQPGPPAGSR